MKAIVTYQGFTESSATRTGTEDLYYDVVRLFAGPDVTTFHPRQWTSDVREQAREIARQGIRRAAIISYSHGQSAACDFADAAYELGIKIDLWLACDPVYRPPWLPRLNCLQPLAFRAMSGHKEATIVVPENIRRVCGVRQERTRPQGHRLEADGGNTRINKFPILPYTHTTIDSSPEWFAMVKSELQHWIAPPHPEPV